MNKYKIGDKIGFDLTVCAVDKFKNGNPIYYSPFVLLQYYNKKRSYSYHTEIDITHSHQVINNFDSFSNTNTVPKYIRNAYQEEMDFIYDDESAFTKVKVLWIYLYKYVYV